MNNWNTLNLLNHKIILVFYLFKIFDLKLSFFQKCLFFLKFFNYKENIYYIQHELCIIYYFLYILNIVIFGNQYFFFIILFCFCYYLFSSNPQLDNYEIKPGKSLKINISVPNLRLFVGNIPKSKGKEEILDEFGKLTGKFQKWKICFKNSKIPKKSLLSIWKKVFFIKKFIHIMKI